MRAACVIYLQKNFHKTCEFRVNLMCDDPEPDVTLSSVPLKTEQSEHRESTE